MSVSVSTHVLDTGSGRPASGVRVELVRDRDVMVTGETDADGEWTGATPGRLLRGSSA